jgi:molybdopterin synthase catalytic subunit
MVDSVGVHSKGAVSLVNALKSVKDKPEFNKAGALAIFVGVVRGQTIKGEKVEKLELEAYEEQANKVIDNICRDLKKEKKIIDVQIHHFLGSFEVGEDLVYVLVAGAHRHNVFPILEKAVERYKREVPIFKKEYVTDKTGTTKSYWVTEHKVK